MFGTDGYTDGWTDGWTDFGCVCDFVGWITADWNTCAVYVTLLVVYSLFDKNNWLIDWLIVWLIVCLFDWLIDC